MTKFYIMQVRHDEVQHRVSSTRRNCISQSATRRIPRPRKFDIPYFETAKIQHVETLHKPHGAVRLSIS